MRKVKWYIIAIIVVLLLFILMFNGQCRRVHKPYEFSQNRDQIVRIEFVSVDKYRYVRHYDDCSAVLVIEPEQYDKLFSDFYEVEWHHCSPPDSGIYGKGLKITYANGEYELIGHCGRYLSEKKDSFDGSICVPLNDWDAFLDKYGIAPNYPND